MSFPVRLWALAVVLLVTAPTAEPAAAGRVTDDMAVLDATGKVVGPIVNVTAPPSASVLIEDSGDVFLLTLSRTRFLSGTSPVYFTDAACQSPPLLRFPPSATLDLAPRAGVGPGSALLVATGLPTPIPSLNAVWNTFADPPACQAIAEDSGVMVGTTSRLILEQLFPPPYHPGLLRGGREARRVPVVKDGSGDVVGRVIGADSDPTTGEVQVGVGGSAVLARLHRGQVLGGSGTNAVYLQADCQGPAQIQIGAPGFVPAGQPLGPFTAVGRDGVFLVQAGPPADLDYASVWDPAGAGCVNAAFQASAVPAQPLAGFAFEPPFALALDRPGGGAGRRPRDVVVAVDSQGRRVGPGLTASGVDAVVGVELDGEIGLTIASGSRVSGLGPALFASGDCSGEPLMAVSDPPGLTLLFLETTMDGQGRVRVPSGPPALTQVGSTLTAALPPECHVIDPPENIPVAPTTPAVDLSALVPPLVLR
jgi:hypothetical protein